MNKLAAVLVFLTAAPAFAQDEHVGFRVREWFARMSGTVEADDNNGNSTRLDLSDDLGLGSQNATTELQAYVALPVVGRIYAGWWEAHDTGSETLTRTITFAGQTFSASTQVDSEFTLDVAYLTYEFAFPTIPIGDLVKLELGAQLGIRGFRGHGQIEGGGFDANDTGTAGLPVVGAHVTAKFFNLIRAEVELDGLIFKYGGNEIHYLETFAEATVEPLPWVFAGVGYKLAEINLQHKGSDDFHINVDIAGFYVTVGVRF